MRNSAKSISATFNSSLERVNVLAFATILAGFVLGVYLLLSRMEYAWNWRVPWEYRRLYFDGLCYTLAVSAGAISLGYILGLAGGIASISGNAFAREAARLYVIFFRGTPLLIQIIIFYFCLAASMDYDNAVVIGIVTLGAFAGAYITEIVRARNRIHRARSDGGRPLNGPYQMADLEVCNFSPGLQADHSTRNRPVCLSDQRLVPSFGNLGPRADQGVRSGERYDLQDL